MGYLIAITDDDSMNLKTAERILRKNGYDTDCLSSGEELLEYLKTNKPDLILLDIHMVGIDGFETMRRLNALDRESRVPVIFLTADDDKETETEAFISGAMDFVAKPFVASILLLRVRNTIELFKLQHDLEEEVYRKTEEVIKEHERNERLSLQVVQTLAETIDAKDKYTKGHSTRVAQYSREIAKRAGYSQREQDEIYMMGLLHDVGKIGIGDAIINKPTSLTDEEYGIIKTHPMVGFEILKNITEMPKLAIGARWHHERYDGTGYPDGLSGKDIPEEARLIAVADAYDAMASHRSYHHTLDQQFVKNELAKGKGTQFDPFFADIMIEMIAEDIDYTLREVSTERLDTRKEEQTPRQEQSDAAFLSVLKKGGINVKNGLGFCMDDISFYSEMLHEFVDTAPTRSSALHDSLSVYDVDSYRITAHSLKSAAKTIGADDFSHYAENMELAAKSGNVFFIEENHADFMRYFTEVVSLVKTALYLKTNDR